MSYKPSRCPDCGENVQMCCCQAWAKYTKSGGGGMSHFNRWWSKQRIEDKEAKRFSHTVCNEAAKPYQVTIDKLTAELAEVMEEAKVWKDRYRKRGYVMDEHAKALERAEVAEAELAEASTIANNNYEVILKCNRQINDLKRELARYRNGVEVEG